jgi:excisionase family DNA binding protein
MNAHLMTIDEVTDLLRCHRITVLRLIRRGALHTLTIARATRFERTEVAALNNRKIAVFPHLTIVHRVALAQRTFRAIIPRPV